MRVLLVVGSMLASKALYNVTTAASVVAEDQSLGGMLGRAALMTPIWIAAVMFKWLPFSASMRDGNGWWSTNVLWDLTGLAVVVASGILIVGTPPRPTQVAALGCMVVAFWLAGR